MKSILLIFLIFLTSCATKSIDVQKPTKPEHSPSDYNPKGVVKYYNQGNDSIIALRKEDAFKRMSENCNGKYKVLEEGVRNEGGVIVYGVFAQDQYWYITYECIN
jgi:hypothetical protein